MILSVTFVDGIEEAFEVGDLTKLRGCRVDGFWLFTTLAGGQVAIRDEIVDQLQLGRVSLADEYGHVADEGGEL